MTEYDASRDIAQRSAHGGAWNADPFATNEPVSERDKTVVNRPANQAQLATPGAAAESARAWRAQGNALDFLGLDQEVSQRVPQRPAEAPVAQPAVQGADSWLMQQNARHDAVESAPEAEDDESAAGTSPLLNAAWQEESRKPARRSKLALPLIAAAVGALGLVGVTMMRRGNPPAEDTALAQPQAPAKPPKKVAAAAPAPAPAEPVVVSHEPAPTDLGPIAQTAPPVSEEPPPLDASPLASRAATEAPAGESQGIDSFVVVVPAHSSAYTPPPAPIDVPAELGPGETSTDENAVEATVEPPVDEHADPSANGASQVLAPVESSTSTPVVAAVESTPPAAEVTNVPAPEPIAVASNSATPPPATAPAVVASTPPVTTPVVVSSTLEPSAPRETATATPVAAVQSARTEGIGPSLPSVAANVPSDAPAYGPVASAVGAPVDAASDAGATPGVQERTSKLELEQVLQLDNASANMRRASAKDLKGVWVETTIPFEAIGAASKVLTPSVGKVRVTLTGGEIFEGGLYAVGEGCVWIDTQYGRMGLAGSRVKSVSQIDSPKNSPALGAAGSQNMAGMDRVRIKTPGGVFYGKVIERDSLHTTVMTDDGARLTLDSKDVELLTQAPIVTIKK